MAKNETVETQDDGDSGSEVTDNFDVTGNFVTDERLSDVQRNQLNTPEKRLERLEAKVFGSQEKEVEDSEDDDTELSAKDKKNLQNPKLSTNAKK